MKRRNLVVTFMLVAALALGVGYAALSDILDIQGTAEISTGAMEEAFNQDVYFSAVVVNNPTTGSTASINADNNDKATFTAKGFTQVGDTISFKDNGDCTSSWEPDGMGWKMIPIQLKKGSANTITIQAFDNLWAPNFDRITIHPVLSDEEVTAIKDPKNPKVLKDPNYFALDGRKLAGTPARGIYIHDGKKLLKQ